MEQAAENIRGLGYNGNNAVKIDNEPALKDFREALELSGSSIDLERCWKYHALHLEALPKSHNYGTPL